MLTEDSPKHGEYSSCHPRENQTHDKITSCWKTAENSPKSKKNDKCKVKNWSHISLFDIDSRKLENCLYVSLYTHFENFLTKHQHGIVKSRSVVTNKFFSLSKIYKALDNNQTDEEAFEKEPHLELFSKARKIVVGGCQLEIM